MSTTNENIDNIRSKLDRKEDIDILNWLTPVDYSPQHSDFINRRQPGTGQWFLDSSNYRSWLQKPGQTLFCPGIPGAGKTILASIVIEELARKATRDEPIGLAYIYSNFRRKDEQTGYDLLRNLLKQLAGGLSSLPKDVKDLHEREKEKKTPPSSDDILKALRSVSGSYSRVFIVVDALDELQLSTSHRSIFLSQVFSLQANSGVSFFATSRHIPDIEEMFRGCLTEKILARDEDVAKHLDGYMQHLPRFVAEKHDLQGEIKGQIIRAVNGMFLLAQLYLDSLRDKTSVTEVRSALMRLEKRSQEGSGDEKKLEVLDQAYDEALERIDSQMDGFRTLGRKVLSWITCAKRPLTTAELQHALAVRPGDTKLDRDNLRDIELMVSVCAGLVTVDQESCIIRLTHYTTQEYFSKRREQLFVKERAEIATACITYLSFDEAQDREFDEIESVGYGAHREAPWLYRRELFYKYAATNWGYHVQEANIKDERLFLDFLGNDGKVINSVKMLRRFPRPARGIHLAAWFGLREVVAVLLRNGHDPNGIEALWDSTPLMWAAKRGHHTVVEELPSAKGINPDAVSTNKPIASMYKAGIHSMATPLWHAAREGHEATVELLLADKKVNPNLTDAANGTSPLWSAVQNSHETIVKLLLADERVIRDLTDNRGRTPLIIAAENGHVGICNLLLADEHVDFDSKDDRGLTPLLVAAIYRHETILRVLLSKEGVNVNTVDAAPHTWSLGLDSYTEDDVTRRSPLQWAADNGDLASVKLLLADRRTDVNYQHTKSGWTALQFAAYNGYDGIVELFLATKGVDLESKATDSKTALSLAAEKGHTRVVALLLTTNAVDPNSKDIDGRTPLYVAANNNHNAVVKLLLEVDSIDPNVERKYGWTPLSSAAANGHEAAVQLLIRNEAVGLNLKTRGGNTPLSIAVIYGQYKVVSLLLATPGVDLNCADEDGKTPLVHAIEDDDWDMSKLLLAAINVNIESRDAQGETPLVKAIKRGNDDIVKLLLENGADAGSKDALGYTPLMHAAESERGYVMAPLFERGVDVEVQNQYGQTPLCLAASKGYELEVTMLLERGANPNISDSEGCPPLLYAAFNEQEEIVMLLLEKTTDLNSRNYIGRSLLFHLVKQQMNGAIELLLDIRGAELDINLKDFYGSTPLSLAVRFGQVAWVKLLLAFEDVDIGSKDNFGRTPLWWAEQRKYPHISELLLENAKMIGKSISNIDLSYEAHWKDRNKFSYEYCDVCELDLSRGGVYFRCKLCRDGDFLICEDCFNIGAQCLGYHELVRQCGEESDLDWFADSSDESTIN